MRFFIHTFGCQMNENDSLLLAGLLKSAGHQPVDSVEQAQIIVINTCCVRENAENHALGYIGSLKKLWLEDRSRIIAVCGCMMQKSGSAELLQRSYRHVGVILGTFAAARLPAYIAEYHATGHTIVDVEERYDGQELLRNSEAAAQSGWRAQVNVNFGCNNFCSYCIVPYVRGRERSRRPEEILQEARELAAHGVREIQLLGQNVNSYGKDLAEENTSFADLLTVLSDVEGIARIRYMTSHPRDFDLRLAERIAQLPKVCRHFHLPVQSGCDRLLRLMNRGYDTQYYEQLLLRLRELFPNAAFTTDLIVGFPGETEDDFQQTLDFMQRCRFDAAYTFIYSRRSGTPAADMPGQVDETVKKERLQRLMDVQNPLSLEINEQMVGQTVEVMVEGESKNNPDMLSGRTDGNKIVIFPRARQLQPGDFVSVNITRAQTWNLAGELLTFI